MLPLMDFVNDIATIAGVAIDNAELQALRNTLDESAATVESGRPMEVHPEWFGGSHAGQVRLGTNTDKAHAALIEAFTEMHKGLESYSEAIHLYAEDLRNQDEMSAATAMAIQTAAELVGDEYGHHNH